MHCNADANAPARDLWLSLDLPEEYLNNLFLSEKPDPAINSSFKLGTIAQTTIGLSGLSAALIYKLRTGKDQTVTVVSRHAVLEFKSEAWYLIDDELPEGDLFDTLAGLYHTKDGGYARIHTNFPHHKQGILDILGCHPTKQSVQEALLRWNAQEFEDVASDRKLCVTKYRTFDEWDIHPQATALRHTPPIQLIKIADAPKRVLGKNASHPLQNIRVLDLTRVLAGPICGRTLAAHGADVLHVTSPLLPALPLLDRDTSRGKRNTQLDLTNPSDRTCFTELCADCDVFLQGYRPGGLKEKGFGAAELAVIRPGIVYASLNAYGWEGPWRDRRGFDSLVQNAMGFGYAEAKAYGQFKAFPAASSNPRPLPCQAIDHASGYMLAFGITAALYKSLVEGGTWEVRVSLAAVAQWMRSLGLLDAQTAFGLGPEYPQRASSCPRPKELETVSTNLALRHSGNPQDIQGGYRHMTAIKHAARLSMTPVREGEAPMELNTHEPRWLPRSED